MANPLRWFRRHQKIMMVFFGAILMAVFGLGSVVSMMDTSPQTDQDAKIEVVTWDGGTLTRGQLDLMKMRHAQVINLQRAIIDEGFQRNRNYNIQGLRLIRPVNLDASVEITDNDIFARVMLAQYAQDRLGLVATDSIVDDYFQMLAMTPLSHRDLAALNQQANGARASMQQMRDQAKIEIMAMRAEDMIEESFLLQRRPQDSSMNQLEAFQDYRRLKQTIECKVVGLMIDNYKKDLDAPSDSELRKIFEEGKSSFADPRGIEPGFKFARKIRVEYVNANRQDFVQLLTQDITREQVEAEYERLVKENDPLVIKPKVPSIDDINQGTESLEDPKSDSKDEGNESKSDATKKIDDAKNAAESGEDKGKEDVEDKAKEDVEGDSKKKDEGGDESGSENGSVQSDLDKYGRTVYTSLNNPRQDEIQKETQETESSDPAPTPPADGSKPQETGDAKQDPVDEKQDDSVVLPSQDIVEFKLLDEELSKAIKESMTRSEVAGKMQSALRKVEKEMTRFNIKYYQWKNTQDAPKDQRLPEPDPIDLAALAAENHLTHGTTRVVDFTKFSETPIGRVQLIAQGRDGRPFAYPLAREIFSKFDNVSLFDPKSVPDFMTGGYAYWITEKVEVRVPTFDECKDKVIEFWENREGLKRAMIAAEEAAAEANATGRGLTETFKTTVEDTGEFSWFAPQFNQAVGYSSPNGVENAGEDFMRAAFALENGKVGFAANNDNSKVYLIELTKKDSRTNNELFAEFKSEIERFQQLPVNVDEVNRIYNNEIISKWIRGIRDEMDVSWLIY